MKWSTIINHWWMEHENSRFFFPQLWKEENGRAEREKNCEKARKRRKVLLKLNKTWWIDMNWCMWKDKRFKFSFMFPDWKKIYEKTASGFEANSDLCNLDFFLFSWASFKFNLHDFSPRCKKFQFQREEIKLSLWVFHAINILIEL